MSAQAAVGAYAGRWGLAEAPPRRQSAVANRPEAATSHRNAMCTPPCRMVRARQHVHCHPGPPSSCVRQWRAVFLPHARPIPVLAQLPGVKGMRLSVAHCPYEGMRPELPGHGGLPMPVCPKRRKRRGVSSRSLQGKGAPQCRCCYAQRGIPASVFSGIQTSLYNVI